MTLVELEVRLKEMKHNCDSMSTIHYNNYMIDYDNETGGFDIMSEQRDEWGNYKIIEWIGTIKYATHVIKLVQ